MFCFCFFSPAVKEIWLASSVDNQGGDLISRIGPYMITTNSVKCMESTLSDEVNTFFFSFFLSITHEPSGSLQDRQWSSIGIVIISNDIT